VLFFDDWKVANRRHNELLRRIQKVSAHQPKIWQKLPTILAKPAL
jgi:hypothetical protein